MSEATIHYVGEYDLRPAGYLPRGLASEARQQEIVRHCRRLKDRVAYQTCGCGERVVIRYSVTSHGAIYLNAMCRVAALRPTANDSGDKA